MHTTEPYIRNDNTVTWCKDRTRRRLMKVAETNECSIALSLFIVCLPDYYTVEDDGQDWFTVGDKTSLTLLLLSLSLST